MRITLTCTAIVAGLAALTPAARADNDWAVISTAGDPDPVTSFDLANPGASNVNIGFVDGNFNRGMDFASFNTFYYFVSTDSLNDPGDRGLWRWENGVNTQLATIGFNDGGDGDATLSNDGNTFFVSTADGDATAGDSIYAFTNLGGSVGFVEVGETGLNQLIGLAMHPVTGVLYGYDSSTESLYTISTTTGAPTLVGASGSSLGAIGGMDFSADGSTLLLSDGSELFLVNPATGALTAAGDVAVNTSALSFRGLVPEPSALALASVGVLAMLRRRRA